MSTPTGTDVDQSDDQSDDLAHLAVDLRLACQRIARRVRYESASAEAAPHQLSVLYHLDKRPSSPGELADVEKVSPPSMTRTVNGLVERGYVSRSPHPSDGRQVVLTLTDLGRQVLQVSRARRDAWMAVRLADLPESDLDVLRRATALLTEVAGR